MCDHDFGFRVVIKWGLAEGGDNESMELSDLTEQIAKSIYSVG